MMCSLIFFGVSYLTLKEVDLGCLLVWIIRGLFGINKKILGVIKNIYIVKIYILGVIKIYKVKIYIFLLVFYV